MKSMNGALAFWWLFRATEVLVFGQGLQYMRQIWRHFQDLHMDMKVWQYFEYDEVLSYTIIV